MKISSRALVAAVAAVSLGSSTALADTWTNPGIGDWFDPANWAGSGPAPFFPVFIDNGGTAIADPTSPFYTSGPIQTDFLHIGVAIVDGSQPPGATGHVQVNDLDVFAGNTLIAGYSALGGSTHGTLQITGGDLEVNAGTSSVGVARDGASQAVGSVLIDGGNASFTSGLSIGIAMAPDNPGQGAFADGSFTVSTGSLSAGSLTVGSATGTTSAQGHLDVGGGVTLTGTGSGLSVGIADETSVAAGSLIAGGPITYGNGGTLRVGYSTGGVAAGTVQAGGPGQSVTLSSMNVGRALNGGIALGTYETINSYSGVSSLLVGSAYNGGTAE